MARSPIITLGRISVRGSDERFQCRLVEGDIRLESYVTQGPATAYQQSGVIG